jgi:ankyrin repeat protein
MPLLIMIERDAKSWPGSQSPDAAVPPLPSAERLQELLFDAARIGRDDVIPALIQAGAAIEGQDSRGHTPLIIASYNGRHATTRLLLSLGAQPDGLVQAQGNSALMGVAFKGHVSIARLLLDAGANPNRVNGVGQTALMMAALSDQRAIIDLLLTAGADSERRDAAGNTATSVAEAQGNQALAAFFAARDEQVLV